MIYYDLVMRCVHFSFNSGGWPRAMEVTMVASNARESLKKENDLLTELAKKASASGDVGYGWEQFFNGWRAVNEKVIGMTDAAFDQALKEEVNRLEGMRKSISGDSAGAKYWKNSLGVDIEDTKRLL